MSHTVILIPIYKSELTPLERFSLEQSLAVLQNREVHFVGPQSLDLRYYTIHFPGLPFIGFSDASFASIDGYNRLLLSHAFYQRFTARKFVLILQTDAVVLKDDLDFWAAQPYDYVGAPWPDGMTVKLDVEPFSGEHAKKVCAYVGNGGFSLRRCNKCLQLLKEFSFASNRWTGSEDMFFAFFGALSIDFVLPGEIAASTFAMELSPDHYFAINGQRVPMGGHGWWKHDPKFWTSRMVTALPADVQLQLPEVITGRTKAVISA